MLAGVEVQLCTALLAFQSTRVRGPAPCPMRCRCCRPCMRAGANQGLGYQTSLELARRGVTLYMVSSQVTHRCGSSRRDLLT